MTGALLTFKGINYKADVWFNGVNISNTTTTVGTFRVFDFDITHLLNINALNVLALRIFRPNKTNDYPY